MEDILEPHKEILQVLLAPRLPAKHININLWASETAKALGIPFDAAYKRVKGAGRALGEAGLGRYVEGRRGRESRFMATVNLKEQMQELLHTIGGAKPQAQIKATMAATSPESFSPSELMALKQLIKASTPQPAEPEKKPSLKELLDGYSAEEILKAVGEKLKGA